jgi:hypothetical protein
MWSDTRRFFIQKGGVLAVDSGTPQEDCRDHECDMASPDTLAHFIKWAETEHRAKHYALILWGHGMGFTNNLTVNSLLDDTQRRNYLRAFTEPSGEWRGKRKLGCILFALAAPPKGMMTDLSSGQTLRNRAVEQVIGESPNHMVDVLGLDACLMGMIETAYAMKDVATVMTASEQDIPGTSLSYDWVRDLTEHPDRKPEAIAAAMVRGYCNKYRACDGKGGRNRTLAAVSLKEVSNVADRLDQLSRALRAAIKNKDARDKVAKARGECLIYGDFSEFGKSGAFHNIDLLHLCDRLIAADVSADVTAAAKPAIEALRRAVIASYADHDEKCQDYGSSGLGIYFPRTKELFEHDELHKVYDKHSVDPDTPDFVKQRDWPDFIKEYSSFNDTNLGVTTPPPCSGHLPPITCDFRAPGR